MFDLFVESPAKTPKSSWIQFPWGMSCSWKTFATTCATTLSQDRMCLDERKTIDVPNKKDTWGIKECSKQLWFTTFLRFQELSLAIDFSSWNDLIPVWVQSTPTPAKYRMKWTKATKGFVSSFCSFVFDTCSVYNWFYDYMSISLLTLAMSSLCHSNDICLFFEVIQSTWTNASRR